MADGADGPRRFYIQGAVLRDGFTQLPNAVLRRTDLSGNAKAMFAIIDDIARYQREEPDLAGLGALIGGGEKAARAALKELADASLVEVKRRGLGRTNSYHLLDPEWVEPSGANLNGPQGRSGTAVGADPSLPSEEKKPKTSTPPTPSAVTAVPPQSKPPPLTKTAGHDIALDALCDACGIDASSPRLKQAVVAMNGRGGQEGIRALYWLECERLAEGHGDEGEAALAELARDGPRFEQLLAQRVREKAARIMATQPWRTSLAPSHVRDLWLDVELQPDRARGISSDEIARLPG